MPCVYQHFIKAVGALSRQGYAHPGRAGGVNRAYDTYLLHIFHPETVEKSYFF